MREGLWWGLEICPSVVPAGRRSTLELSLKKKGPNSAGPDSVEWVELAALSARLGDAGGPG